MPVPSIADAARTGAAASDVPREQPLDGGDDLGRPLGAGQIRLGHDRHAVTDRERVEQREVLERLGARPVVGGDDQQRRVDLARADEHVADQPVVAGHVDEVELGAVGQREVGVADVDRHPAAALLGQAVGVDPGQRPEQRRLAVVDVAGGADDDGHRRPRQRAGEGRGQSRRRRPARPSGGRAGPRRARSGRPPPGRIRGGARRVRRRRARRPRGRPTSVSPGSEPPPTVEVSSLTMTRGRSAAGSAAWIASARRPSASGVVAIIRQTGMSVVARPARYRPERRREGGERSPCRAAWRAPAGPCGSGR